MKHSDHFIPISQHSISDTAIHRASRRQYSVEEIDARGGPVIYTLTSPEQSPVVVEEAKLKETFDMVASL